MKTAVDLLLGHRPLEEPDSMASRVLVRHLRARLPPAAGTGPERHRLLDPARADPSDLEVWDSPTAEGRAWTLAHRVGIRELLGLKADATWLQRCIKPPASTRRTSTSSSWPCLRGWPPTLSSAAPWIRCAHTIASRLELTCSRMCIRRARCRFRRYSPRQCSK